jgi:hypothetical protein
VDEESAALPEFGDAESALSGCGYDTTITSCNEEREGRKEGILLSFCEKLHLPRFITMI